MERLYRTQVLLEPEQHRELSRLARRSGQSVSNLVREAVTQYLEAEAELVRQQEDVVVEIRALRARILARRGGKPIDTDIAALSDEMREERANELLRNVLGCD